MSANPNSPVLSSIKNNISTLSFNRPRSLNAINVETAEVFLAAVDASLANPDVRVIVIKGEGRAFMAGGDVGAFKKAGDKAPEVCNALIKPLHEAITKLAVAPQIVVASLHGAVAGAGMSLALSADLAIAADNVMFNLAYIKIGNSPDCSGSWYLYHLLGLRKAMEIALLGENIDVDEALRLGLVNKVVPAEELSAQTMTLAARLASSAPLGLASTKKLLRQASGNSLPEQLDAEQAHFVANAGSQDFREAVTAFFEKRKAIFTGK